MDALYADENVLVGRVVLEPGERIAEEIHVGQTETIVLVSGSIEVGHAMDRESVLMHAAHAALGQLRITFVEADKAHIVENWSATESAEYIAILRKVS